MEHGRAVGSRSRFVWLTTVLKIKNLHIKASSNMIWCTFIMLLLKCLFSSVLPIPQRKVSRNSAIASNTARHPVAVVSSSSQF